MSRSEREKGRKAEAKVRAIYEEHGFTVRGLEGAGDHLAIGHGVVIHSEVKRQEVLRLPLWTRQAMAEAPAGAVPVLAYRRNREPWQALAPESHLYDLLEQAGLRAGVHYTLIEIGHYWFVSMPLRGLLDALGHAFRTLSPQEAVS